MHAYDVHVFRVNYMYTFTCVIFNLFITSQNQIRGGLFEFFKRWTIILTYFKSMNLGLTDSALKYCEGTNEKNPCEGMKQFEIVKEFLFMWIVGLNCFAEDLNIPFV